MILTRQEPYVGNEYYNSTLLGVRIMVVGASHYCGEFNQVTRCTSGCKCFGRLKAKYRDRINNVREQHFGKQCELFTKNVIERYLVGGSSDGDGGWKRTYTKFLKSLFTNCDADVMCCRKLMDYLVFTEYLQGAEGKNASEKDDSAFGASLHYKTLMVNIAEYRPDVVIVWGNRVWSQIVKRCAGIPLSSTRREATIDNHKVQFVKITHPSSRGYYKTDLQRQFKDAGIKLIVKSDLLKRQ